jgi:hypothetical protein
MGVIDKGGYLSQHQSRLTNLSLVTDGTCPQPSFSLEGLSDFSCLKRLAWEGIQHAREIEALRQCIYRNWSHLTNLSIGFSSSAASRALCWETIGLHRAESLNFEDSTADQLTSLSPLSTLSLSNVTLPTEISLYGSFFRSLRSLTLRKCSNQLNLLRWLSRPSNSPQLEHVELCIDSLFFEPGEECDFDALVEFLFSFQGLKSLYLRLSNFPTWEFPLQKAIGHHRSSLKRLVYHERQLEQIDDAGLFEEDRDVSPDWIFSDIVDLSRMTALALCVSPSAAVSSLRTSHDSMEANVLSTNGWRLGPARCSCRFYI